MAGLIVLPLISLLTVGVIILTQNIARSPLSYLMLLRTKDIIMAIDLLICTALATAIYYVLVARDPQPQSSIDGSVEPPMIPSWVPWAGSLFHYFTHQLTFFKRYSIQHGSAFKFRLFGKTIVAISSPTAISNLFRDHSGAFEVINRDSAHVLSGINVGDDRMLHVYSVLVGRVGPPLYRAMMPSNLPVISSRFTQDLLKGLSQLDLSSPRTSLNEFVHRMMYNTSSTAFFGTDSPLDTYEDFKTFDRGSALIVRHLGIFARSATAARDALYAAWNRHIIKHWVSEGDGYLEGAVDVMTNIYRELNKADLTSEEIPRLMGLIIWTIHTNVLALTTWVMCHLLVDRDTYTSVCQEIRAFVDEKFPHIGDIAKIDPRVLEGDDFPLLNSFIREVIRTKTSFGTTRIATRDTVIRDERDKAILIHKGETVFVNYQGMHSSPELHSEPEVFKADRFVEGGSSSYNSYTFGMGKHACPGRNYANFVIRQFVILTLALYDIRAEPDRPGGAVSLPEIYKCPGLTSMTFFRPKSDLSITFHKRIQ